MKRRYLRYLLLISLGLTLLAVQDPRSSAAPGEPGRLAFVYVVNGSGDSTSVTENLCEIFKECGYPLKVYTIRWCRWGQMAKDHADIEAQLIAAERLHTALLRHRTARPQDSIVVIGHSAGTHVILDATRGLPANCIDRIILLASSVSDCYDLRWALYSSRDGIDAWYSTRDRIVALGAEVLGTADKQATNAAGQFGFKVPPHGVPGAQLYQKLRQHEWTPEYAWTGHRGGHTGFTRKGFLEAYIVPQILQSAFPEE
jgi:pimeloyl-ACP methyl ester carboxylesterase